MAQTQLPPPDNSLPTNPPPTFHPSFLPPVTTKPSSPSPPTQTPSSPPPPPPTPTHSAAQLPEGADFDLIQVFPWRDSITELSGYDPRSTYVEMFWLPIVGPSCVWLMRRLAIWLEEHPEGHQLSAKNIAQEIGIGTKFHKGPPLKKPLTRCSDFGLVHLKTPTCIYAKRRIPQITSRMFHQLSDRLKIAHKSFIATQDPLNPQDPTNTQDSLDPNQLITQAYLH